jgi:hypothetical protein
MIRNLSLLIIFPLIVTNLIHSNIVALNPAETSSISFSEPVRFSELSIEQNAISNAVPLYVDHDNLGLVYVSSSSDKLDSLILIMSSDGGESWHTKYHITSFVRLHDSGSWSLTGTITRSGRIIIVYTITDGSTVHSTQIIYSDDQESTWSPPQNLFAAVRIAQPVISVSPSNKLSVVGFSDYLFSSEDEGENWEARRIGVSSKHLLMLSDSNFLAFYEAVAGSISSIYLRASDDNGDSWDTPVKITPDTLSASRPRVITDKDGSMYIFYEVENEIQPGSMTFKYRNIHYQISEDEGSTWSSPEWVTRYPGNDLYPEVTMSSGMPFVSFISDRWYGNNQIWLSKIGITEDNNSPPTIYQYFVFVSDRSISVRAYVAGYQDIASVYAHLTVNDLDEYEYLMVYSENNNNWHADTGPFAYGDKISVYISVTDEAENIIISESIIRSIPIPIETAWLSGGSLQNWYSNRGVEIEHGFQNVSQYGMRWPAIYPYQDMQVSKGLWIGARNFVDENENYSPHKVVHTGPRVSGENVFYPIEFKLIGRFEQPEVYVNGMPAGPVDISELDEVDPTIPADRMILNTVNTQLGLTMERRIYQFGNEWHDNYHLIEYTFTNTGNVNANQNIELPDQTLEDVMVFFQYRLAPVRETRYLIANHTGWGRNTIIDARGVPGIDPDDVSFRAQFVWHGYDPTKNVPYDNTGAPIFYPDTPGFIDQADTIGRLGAPHFGGVVTIHADGSVTDQNNDLSQPSTTHHFGSDVALNSGNDPFNSTRMEVEYEMMTSGHANPRHAYIVEPGGNFAVQRANPNLGTSGGFSIANGYGPYTIGPGESVKIVVAEGVSGLGREAAINIGKQYKDSDADDNMTIVYMGEEMTKNQWVMTGRDSLFQTFERAIANYNNGYAIPRAPLPPRSFDVNKVDETFQLQWSVFENASEDISGFEIYRTSDKYYNEYEKVYSAASDEREWIDTNVERSKRYFYYILSVSDENGIDGNGFIPPDKLRSNRYYTQTYEPALLTSARIDDLFPGKYFLAQNYPNPFNPATTIRYSIAHQEQVLIKIYDLLGREITTLVENTQLPGTHEITFDASQLPSGVYIYRMQVGEYVETKRMTFIK